MSFAWKIVKKWISGSFLLALCGPTHKTIFKWHLSCNKGANILFCPLYHKHPLTSYQKIIFSWFFMQNSLNTLGNKSMGDPQVKLVHFPMNHSLVDYNLQCPYHGQAKNIGLCGHQRRHRLEKWERQYGKTAKLEYEHPWGKGMALQSNTFKDWWQQNHVPPYPNRHKPKGVLGSEWGQTGPWVVGCCQRLKKQNGCHHFFCSLSTNDDGISIIYYIGL